MNLYGKLYDVSLPESFATEENKFESDFNKALRSGAQPRKGVTGTKTTKTRGHCVNRCEQTDFGKLTHIVTTSEAPLTSSKALVPNSFLLLLVRHLLLLAMHMEHHGTHDLTILGWSHMTGGCFWLLLFTGDWLHMTRVSRLKPLEVGMQDAKNVKTERVVPLAALCVQCGTRCAEGPELEEKI